MYVYFNDKMKLKKEKVICFQLVEKGIASINRTLSLLSYPLINTTQLACSLPLSTSNLSFSHPFSNSYKNGGFGFPRQQRCCIGFSYR